MSSLSPGLVRRAGLATATESLAGAIADGATVVVALQPYPFFPMLHSAAAVVQLRVTGDNTDQADPDLPRLAWFNQAGAGSSWDVDYRYVAA